MPIEYYFFYDPTRYLNLLLLEFGIYQSALQVCLALRLTVTRTLTLTLTLNPSLTLTLTLQGCFLLHLVLSWYFRERYYRLYLRVKHWVKSRTHPNPSPNPDPDPNRDPTLTLTLTLPLP